MIRQFCIATFLVISVVSALPPPSIISPPKVCTFHKDLNDDEGYFKSACIIETSKSHGDAQLTCMRESTRLFVIDDDETVTANLKTFLSESYDNACRNCLFWVDGRDLWGCNSFMKTKGKFTNAKSQCFKPAYVVCEFWNRDYDNSVKSKRSPKSQVEF